MKKKKCTGFVYSFFYYKSDERIEFGLRSSKILKEKNPRSASYVWRLIFGAREASDSPPSACP
eukprot:m.33398 g.33398  ORF g.33398 m.33398 type:complete len:63 (+) comp6447_c0_seq2:56-244(+)